MKRIISVFLTLIICLSLLPETSWAAEAMAGSGTETDPYQIATAEQLSTFRDMVNNGATDIHAVLTADIVFNEGITFSMDEDYNPLANGKAPSGLKQWVPIGKPFGSGFDLLTNGWFNGSFDGQGHTISGLYSDYQTDVSFMGKSAASLFTVLGPNGVVKNVGVVNSYFRGEAAAAIVGASQGVVDTCFSDAFVVGVPKPADKASQDAFAGGIVAVVFHRETAGQEKTAVRNCAFFGHTIGLEIKKTQDDGSEQVTQQFGGIMALNGYIFPGTKNYSNNYYIKRTGDRKTRHEEEGVVITYGDTTYNDTSYNNSEYFTSSNRPKSAAESKVKSGEIAYTMNRKATGLKYYQNVDQEPIDLFPVLDQTHGTVWNVTDCRGVQFYSNSSENKDHVEVIEPAVNATCDTTGLTEGKKCSVCGKVLIAQEVVDAMGHTEMIDQAVAATCTEDGLAEGKHCSVCNTVLVKQETVKALGHTEEIVPGKEATDTESGLTEGLKCSVCGVILKEQFVIPAGHKHDHKAVVTAPTCTDKGYTTYTCSCGDSYKGDEVSAKGHTEQVVPGKEATDTETGLTDGLKCSVCGVILKEQTVIPAVHKHDYEAVGTEPTCTDKGYTTYTCSCGDTYKSDEVPAKGHSEVVDDAVDATCTETGLTEGMHCSVCDVVLVEQEEVPELGHSWGDWTITKEPTADSEGIRERECIVCGITETETIPTEPTEPEDPGNSTKPTDPWLPSKPTEPTTPTDPSDPGNTAQPTEPSKPDDTTKPSVPTDPTIDPSINWPSAPDLGGNGAAISAPEIGGEIVYEVEDDLYIILDVDPLMGISSDELMKNLSNSELEDYEVHYELPEAKKLRTSDRLTIQAKKAGKVVSEKTFVIVILGDLNCDGMAMSNDSALMVKLVNNPGDTAPEVLVAADLNRDEVIGANDAQRLIYRYYHYSKEYTSALD